MPVLMKEAGMLLKPALGDLKFRADMLHLAPEASGMVHFAQVHEFVKNDVIADEQRRLDEPPVKGNGTAARAGTPARFLSANRDSADA
jgi:hypothetical protein